MLTRLRHLPVFVVLLYAGITTVFAEKSTQALTVMTFNIRVGAGVQQWGVSPYKIKDEVRLDLTPVAAAIASVKPDIVGLQEVYGEKQAKQLARLLGMRHAYVPHGKGRNGGWWGVALLSRYPVSQVQRHQVSQGWGDIKSVLKATVTVAGRDVVVLVMHKDHDLKDGGSFRNLVSLVRQNNDRPLLLAGDLNIKPDDERHRILSPWLSDTAGMINSHGAKQARNRGTVIGPKQDRYGLRIDYVMVNRFFDVVEAALVPHAHWQASDHLAYFTRLRIKQ